MKNNFVKNILLSKVILTILLVSCIGTIVFTRINSYCAKIATILFPFLVSVLIYSFGISFNRNTKIFDVERDLYEYIIKSEMIISTENIDEKNYILSEKIKLVNGILGNKDNLNMFKNAKFVCTNCECHSFHRRNQRSEDIKRIRYIEDMEELKNYLIKQMSSAWN
ncbi:hypothetical protein ACQW5G_01115 [Fructilactobacillus sp. Tb1]|uniref:hypothetical protein n=1 Tax=Fructilactobacillus sp. Tb1 TaxID=3422304 RepID=UPI003D2A7130